MAKHIKTDKKWNKTTENPSRSTSGRKRYRISRKGRIRLAILVLALVLLITLIVKACTFIRWHSPVKLTDEGYTHAKQFENCLALNGVDLSEHQGDDVNFRKLKASGVDFVFLRAGYRGAGNGNLNVDTCFSRNVREANKVGLMVGAYYYSQATTSAEAEEEAAALLEIADGFDFDLPLMIDYEIYPGGRLEKVIKSGTMNVASMYHDIVLAFCRKVEAEGYDSGIYANTDMFTHYMDATLLDYETNLWVADFGSKCGLKTGYRFWQCSDSATVGGVDIPVDHDFMYISTDGMSKIWYVEPGKKVSLEKCHVALKRSSVKFKRSGATVKAIVTDAEGKRMREGKDYKLSFVRNMERGTAYVIVKGINGYRDIITAAYTIK